MFPLWRDNFTYAKAKLCYILIVFVKCFIFRSTRRIKNKVRGSVPCTSLRICTWPWALTLEFVHDFSSGCYACPKSWAQPYIDRVRLKHQLVKILQVIIPSIFSPFLTLLLWQRSSKFWESLGLPFKQSERSNNKFILTLNKHKFNLDRHQMR